MYDIILAEMTELNGLIEEIESIHQLTTQTSSSYNLSDINRKYSLFIFIVLIFRKNSCDIPPTQPAPKKIMKSIYLFYFIKCSIITTNSSSSIYC